MEVVRLLKDAFTILEELQVCSAVSPQCLVACEADLDNRRFVILQMIRRSEEQRNADNILSFDFWTQDNLSTYSMIRNRLHPCCRMH